MKKKRRRDTKKVGPSEEYLDQLWSKAIKLKFDHRCVRCGNPNVQSHHIRGRRRRSLRWDLNNGVTLCPRCHTSVHNYPWVAGEVMQKAGVDQVLLQQHDMPLQDYLKILGMSKKKFRESVASTLNDFIKRYESDNAPKTNYDLRKESPL